MSRCPFLLANRVHATLSKVAKTTMVFVDACLLLQQQDELPFIINFQFPPRPTCAVGLLYRTRIPGSYSGFAFIMTTCIRARVPGISVALI